MKRNLSKRAQKITLTTFSRLSNIKPQNGVVRAWRQPRRSVSCPCLALSRVAERPYTEYLPRSYSAIYHADQKHIFCRCNAIPEQQLFNFSQKRAASTAPNSKTHKANAMQNLEAACACPCPCPCPGGNSLPPPCNTPAKCLQYMTGYYYYPYGTWFCGPYHMSTGACGPCSGPVTPGGPCGPSGPCPGGPCGPPGVTPCCACGPLGCCSICGTGTPSNTIASAPNPQTAPCSSAGPFNMYSMYDPYAFNAQMQYNSYDPYGTFSPYGSWAQPNVPGPHFGPGFNIPISPMQVDPMTFNAFNHTQISPPAASPTPKSSVRINPNFLKEAQAAGMPTPKSDPPHIPKPPIPTRKVPKCSVYFNASALIDSKAYTGVRPIAAIDSICSKNLTPQPLRPGPPSRYDATCSLSKSNPFTKPRINKRTLPHLDTVQVCYYTTRSMEKYASTASSVEPKRDEKRPNQLEKENKLGTKPRSYYSEANSKPLCYWCLISDKNSTSSSRRCELIAAQKKLPISDIRSKHRRQRNGSFEQD